MEIKGKKRVPGLIFLLQTKQLRKQTNKKIVTFLTLKNSHVSYFSTMIKKYSEFGLIF